jgi:glycosyltransferase involved in cell wall biosynthesis
MPVKVHHPAYLREAIDSIFAQTSPHWRLVIVADESLRTQELEGVREVEDERVDVIHTSARNLAGAINVGMRHCRTPFAASLFADDLWAPKAVQVLTDHVRAHPEIDFFHSSRRIIDDDGNPVSSIHHSVPEMHLEDFRRGSSIKHLLCWRVERALAIGGIDESISPAVGPDDWDFPWSMAESGARFMAIQDCLYVYRDHRRCYRLTIHEPRTAHRTGIRDTMRKHGVDEQEIDRWIDEAESSFLKQCLYESRIDRLIRRIARSQPGTAWRQTYR